MKLISAIQNVMNISTNLAGLSLIVTGYISVTRWMPVGNMATFHMVTSLNGGIFSVTGPLCGEFTGHRGIHRSPVNSPHKGQWRRALMFSLIYASTNDWVNNRDAGGLRRHRAYYYVSVMVSAHPYGRIMHNCMYQLSLNCPCLMYIWTGGWQVIPTSIFINTQADISDVTSTRIRH